MLLNGKLTNFQGDLLASLQVTESLVQKSVAQEVLHDNCGLYASELTYFAEKFGTPKPTYSLPNASLQTGTYFCKSCIIYLKPINFTIFLASTLNTAKISAR